MKALRMLGPAIFGTLAAVAILPAAAFADHESRDRVLSETGLNMVLVVLVFVAVVITLAAFAATIIWWERRDPRGSGTERGTGESRR